VQYNFRVPKIKREKIKLDLAVQNEFNISSKKRKKTAISMWLRTNNA